MFMFETVPSSRRLCPADSMRIAALRTLQQRPLHGAQPARPKQILAHAGQARPIAGLQIGFSPAGRESA
jgi:hypothetical protein